MLKPDDPTTLFGGLSFALRRWRFGIYLAVAAAVADGFGWTTPAQQFARIQVRDSSITARADRLEAREDTEFEYLRALLALQCADARPRDLQLLQIKCPPLTGRMVR